MCTFSDGSFAMAPSAMMTTPALSGSRSVRSWLPPSGKMHRQPPSDSCLYTLSYMCAWFTYGCRVYVTPASSASSAAPLNGVLIRSSVSLTISVISPIA